MGNRIRNVIGLLAAMVLALLPALAEVKVRGRATILNKRNPGAPVVSNPLAGVTRSMKVVGGVMREVFTLPSGKEIVAPAGAAGYGVSLKFGMEKTTDTTGYHKLGTLGFTPDGRQFRYALANGAIGAGQLVMQDDVSNASHDTDLAVAAAEAVGETSIGLTNAGATVTADQFKDGYMFVNDVDGEGHTYVVKSNSAATTTAALTVTLEEDDSIAEALTTSSQVGLRANPYKDVEVWDADDIDGIPLGVAPCEVADNEYFWLCVHGPQAVLFDSDDNGVLGRAVIPSISVDGAARGYDLAATSATPNQVIGHAMVASVDTEYTLVFLTIE